MLGSLLKPSQLAINDESQLLKFTETGTQSGKPKHVYRCKTCSSLIYSVPEVANGKLIAFSPCLLDNGFEKFIPNGSHFEEEIPNVYKHMAVNFAKL